MELSEFLKPFVKESGFVEFGRNDNLAECTKDVPLEYGAYVIHRDTKDGEIVYIGKAGTISQNGEYKSVKLRKRLNANHSHEARQKYFPKKMDEEPKISKLFIEWFVIDEEKIIPAYFEALLMQLFYSSNHRLPLWNKTF